LTPTAATRKFFAAISLTTSGWRRWTVIAASFLSFGFQTARAQRDPEERKNLYLGVSVPVDNGKGDMGAAGYFYWNKPRFPTDNTQFRLIYAGVFADALLTYPRFFDPDTSLNIGARALGFFDGLTEYRNGDDLDAQRFNGNSASARIAVEREFFKLWDQLPFNISVEYSARVAQYQRRDSTLASFVLPRDGLTQSAEIAARLGGIAPGIVQRQGAELFVTVESAWRSHWAAWGPSGAAFATSNRYRKITAGAGLLLPLSHFFPTLRRHHIGLQITGGTGSRLDRLSCYKLGGSLPTGRTPTQVRGFYPGELFATDFALVNFSYELPLAEWRQLALHLGADYATLRRDDIAERHWSDYRGAGVGASLRLFGADLLVGYGYGINAPRLGKRGGHEITLQLFKAF
jgi:hemolysin activation/secretion protein